MNWFYPGMINLFLAINLRIQARLGAQAIERNGFHVSVVTFTQKTAAHLPENQPFS